MTKTLLSEKIVRMIVENRLYKGLYRQNKGIFYRGEDPITKKTGVGFGAMGNGAYLTWREKTAIAYAKFGKGVVNKYKVKKNLKIADVKGKEVIAIKKMLGFEPWDYTNDPQFNKILTFELKRQKFDGVVSDNDMEGLVISDPKNLELVE